MPPPPVRHTKLVLIPASRLSSGRFKALPEVETEISCVASIAASVCAQHDTLSEAGSTNADLSKALESANIVHVACHGIQDVANPLQSAFHLSDTRVLTVSDLMELNLKHAHLAFLSACETAKGDRQQPDQAIHLAATMLFVGFKSVVGTMW
jgi:CHAT domain-containing protein